MYVFLYVCVWINFISFWKACVTENIETYTKTNSKPPSVTSYTCVFTVAETFQKE